MGPIVPAPAAHIGRRRPRKPIQPRKSLSATSNRPVLPHILVPSFADLNIADNRHAGSSLSPRHPRDDRLARPSRPATITPHSPTSTSMPKSDSPGSPVSGSAPASTNQAMTLTPLDTPTESRWSPPSPTSGTSQDRNTEAGVGVNRAHHLSTESLSATAVPSRAVSPGSTWGAVVGPSLGISIRYFPQKGTIFTKYAEDPQQDRQRISTDVYEQYRIDPQALWLWSVIDPRSGPLYGTGYSLPHMSLSSSKRASASATGGHVSAQRRMGGGGSARGDNGSIPASDSDSVTGGGSGSSRTRKSHKRRDGSSNPAATPNSAKRFKRDQGLGSAKSGAAEGSPQMRRRTGAGDDQLATGEAIPSSPSLNNKRSLKSLNGAFEVMDLDLSSGPATGATSSAVSTHGDSTGPRGPTARASSRASTPVIGSDGEGSEYSVNDVSQHGYSTRRQQQIYYNALTHSAQAYEDSFKPASEISTRDDQSDDLEHGSDSGETLVTDRTTRNRGPYRRQAVKKTPKWSAQGFPLVFWPKGAPLDVSDDQGYSNLTEPEVHVCSTLRVPPHQYLQIKETLLQAAIEAEVALDDGVEELERTRARLAGRPVDGIKQEPGNSPSNEPMAPTDSNSPANGVKTETQATGEVRPQSTVASGAPAASGSSGDKPRPKKMFRKRDAQKMCRIDVNKTSKIVDWFVDMGWITLS